MRGCRILGLLLWILSPALHAAILDVGVGLFTESNETKTFYLLELSQDKLSFADFQINALAHSNDSETIYDSAEFLYQGVGLDFDPLRINLELGYVFSLDKFVLDEVDYGVSRSVIGARAHLDLHFLQLFGSLRSYRPSWSPSTHIDSFEITFNPRPYQLARAGLTLDVKNLALKAEAGQFRELAGRFDILGESYGLSLEPVSYGKVTLQLTTAQKALLIAEWHQFIDDQGDRLLFRKLSGSILHRDAFQGGLLALGFEF